MEFSTDVMFGHHRYSFQAFTNDKAVAELLPEEQIAQLRSSLQAAHVASVTVAATTEAAAPPAADDTTTGTATAAAAESAGATAEADAPEGDVAMTDAATTAAAADNPEVGEGGSIKAADAEAVAAISDDTAAAADQAPKAAESEVPAAVASDSAAPAVAAPQEATAALVDDAAVKAHWLAQHEALYQATKQQLDKRRPFEDAIKRPYFHVKPLDPGQLTNWCKYLDFIEAEGDTAAAITVYERCLVPCANYPGEATGLCCSSLFSRSMQLSLCETEFIGLLVSAVTRLPLSWPKASRIGSSYGVMGWCWPHPDACMH